jgi:hypothetical protein
LWCVEVGCDVSCVGIDVLGGREGIFSWRWDDGGFCFLAREGRERESTVGAEDGEETSTLGRVGCRFGISCRTGCVCDAVRAEFGCDGVFSIVES